ncbi:MAG: hypothetical protein JWO46_2227, partial [Nocardioidaceae bacterium]|nr:hypothetical protein [Nocardioidaceae bacterium]
WGAPVGAAITVLTTEFLIPRISAGNSGPLELIIFGVILVLAMTFAPNGLVDDLTARLKILWRRVRRDRGATSTSAADVHPEPSMAGQGGRS